MGNRTKQRGKKKLTTEEFIRRAKLKHGEKYDYSETTYFGKFKKLNIVCKIHGVFSQEAYGHIKGKGCIDCSGFKPLTTEIFINRSNEIYENKYDYSKSEFISVRKKLIILCPIHGEFIQTARGHLTGRGCKKCAGFLTKEEYIEKANLIHGNKYDYSKVVFNGTKKIEIICPIHGSFKSLKGNHLNKTGCPICSDSKGERIVRIFLEENKILYETQKTFPECKNKSLLYFDFYIPHLNICIEYDGVQHYKIVEFFGGKKEFYYRKTCDEIKNKYCIDKNIPLYRIRYDDSIIEKLNNIFNYK